MHFKAERDFSPTRRKKERCTERNKQREKNIEINDQKPPSNCTLSQVSGALQGGERFFTNQKEERKMYRKKQTKREKH